LRDVIDQLRTYGDALERVAPARPLDDARPRPPRVRWRVLAVACVLLTVVGAAIVISRTQRNVLDESALPAPYVGTRQFPPGTVGGTWLAVLLQEDGGDTFGRRFSRDSARPAVTLEDGRIVVRTDCSIDAAPVSYEADRPGSVELGAITFEEAWVHQGCAPADDLAPLFAVPRLEWGQNSAYDDLRLSTATGLVLSFARSLSEDVDAQYLLEHLRDIVTFVDVAGRPRLADALPNDLYRNGGTTSPVHRVVVIGEAIGHEVVDASELADMGEDDTHYLRVRFRVDAAWGPAGFGDELTVALVTRGDDGDRMGRGFATLGRVVLVLNPDSPVYDFAPETFAIGDNGGLILTIGADGTLALPAFPPTLAEDLLADVETLDQLRAALDEPNTTRQGSPVPGS